MILVDAISTNYIDEYNTWRLGRISTVWSVHRVCAACAEAGVQVLMDLGSFCWFKCGDPDDEKSISAGSLVKVWWQQ